MPVAETAPDAILAELPGLLLSAEMQGVPADFSEIRIAEDAADLADGLSQHFAKPVNRLGLLPGAKSSLDLLPPAWQSELRSRARGDSLKQNLLVAGVVWLVLIALAFGYLAWLKHRMQLTQREHDAMKPRFASIEKQMSRWDSLAPVIEPKRYPTEVLHQLWKAWEQDPKLQFTSFEYRLREFVMKGEGTTDARFALITRLKKDKDLDSFDLQFPPEQPLNDDRFSFSITGKPR